MDMVEGRSGPGPREGGQPGALAPAWAGGRKPSARTRADAADGCPAPRALLAGQGSVGAAQLGADGVFCSSHSFKGVGGGRW